MGIESLRLQVISPVAMFELVVCGELRARWLAAQRV